MMVDNKLLFFIFYNGCDMVWCNKGVKCIFLIFKYMGNSWLSKMFR